MPDNESEGLNDPESVAFVGELRLPEPEVDFTKPLWAIDINYKNTVTTHVVNGDTAEEAWQAVLLKAKLEGEPIATAESISVTAVEDIRVEGES